MIETRRFEITYERPFVTVFGRGQRQQQGLMLHNAEEGT
jgi:hypothetical protein